MHFQVACFSVMEDLADVVYWTLDGMVPPWGGPICLPPWARTPRAHGSRDLKMSHGAEV
jgi:hypothetical protein